MKPMTYLYTNPPDGCQQEESGSIIMRQFNLIELLIFIDWYTKFGGRLSGNLKRILCRNKLQDKSRESNGRFPWTKWDFRSEVKKLW